MNELDKLLEEIDNVRVELEDFNKFKHLFSDDDAEKKLAKLRQMVGQVSVFAKVSMIKKVGHPSNKVLQGPGKGLVKVRPCGDEYEGKTYIGFHIGDLATGSSVAIEEDEIKCNWSRHNPAIYIPELNKVIYGYQSWWGAIGSETDLSDISDEDIQDVWYVKLLNKMGDEKSKECSKGT